MFTNSQVRYLVRESFAVFRRLKGLTVVSTLIMSVSLMMLALFALVTINLENLVRSFRQEIEINVFLEEDLPTDKVHELRSRVLGQEGVASVSYVSKENALAEFREQLGTDSDLLEVLEENPLPASLQISLEEIARQSERLEFLAGWLRELPGVDEVRYGDLWVQRLEEYIRVFYILDFLVGSLVVVSALFVISNTVRLTVMARERTIEVMRLVGATNWFIRMPFVVEGAVQGAMAGGLAMLVLWGVHRYTTGIAGPLVFYDGPQILGFVMLCSSVSALGSLSSLRRFLRL